jgi:hypothetical protein
MQMCTNFIIIIIIIIIIRGSGSSSGDGNNTNSFTSEGYDVNAVLYIFDPKTSQESR